MLGAVFGGAYFFVRGAAIPPSRLPGRAPAVPGLPYSSHHGGTCLRKPYRPAPPQRRQILRAGLVEAAFYCRTFPSTAACANGARKQNPEPYASRAQVSPQSDRQGFRGGARGCVVARWLPRLFRTAQSYRCAATTPAQTTAAAAPLAAAKTTCPRSTPLGVADFFNSFT